jgi:hypothetical protein
MAKQEIENTNFLIDINEKSFDNKAFTRKHRSFLVK